MEAHWEVRLAAVHVEAQREEARYTVLGALSGSPAAPYLAISPVVPVWLVGIYPVLVRW